MIQFSQVRPEPLLPNGIAPQSDTWATECQFQKGKKYLVTAPSGKGKSTFLHIIYGLRKDFTGQVSLDGQNVNDMPATTWADYREKELSIVFQNLRLFPQLTAWENLLIKNQLTSHKTEEEIKIYAKILGIADLLQQPAATLSYGQRQRVAIIRALCQPFSFLLLDEPFSHLDKENIKIATQLIQTEVEKQQAGMILVSLGEPYSFHYDEEIIL